jgi:hypothetical protein
MFLTANVRGCLVLSSVDIGHLFHDRDIGGVIRRTISLQTTRDFSNFRSNRDSRSMVGWDVTSLPGRCKSKR